MHLKKVGLILALFIQKKDLPGLITIYVLFFFLTNQKEQIHGCYA